MTDKATKIDGNSRIVNLVHNKDVESNDYGLLGTHRDYALLQSLLRGKTEDPEFEKRLAEAKRIWKEGDTLTEQEQILRDLHNERI